MPTLMKLVPNYPPYTKEQFIADAVNGKEPDWQYLKSYDLDAYQGRGRITCTRKREAALRFPDRDAAMAAWLTASKTLPYRPDGLPNRPLTAYHATFEEV